MIPGTKLDRRSFLQATLLSSLGAAAACGDSDKRPVVDGGGVLPDASPIATPADAAVMGGDPPFSVWRAMRETLRASPDALVDRANALIAAKDARGLFAFVRDEIATLPPVDSVSTANGVRWGVRATLRCGAGTPRERAELLASLLQRAGFQARVVAGDPDGALAESAAVDRVFLRSIPRSFAPAPSPPAIGGWVRALTGQETAPEPTFVDPKGERAQKLADDLAKLLPAGATANGFTLALFRTPLVELQDGAAILLNPLLPDAVYGESYVKNVGPADAVAYPKLTARLSMARTREPDVRVELVRATYGVDELAGRVLVAHASPVGDLFDLLGKPVSDLTTFIPVLSVTSADASALERRALTRAGGVFTTAGDVYVRASDGTTSCNGAPLGSGNTADAANVTQVAVAAKAAGFPAVELLVALKDSGGNPVGGLPASVFTVEEDGARVPVSLRENGTGGPRVLFVVDTTGSQPAMTPSLANALAAAVFAGATDARVQVVPGDASVLPTDSGYTLTTTTALATALQVPGAVTSNLYRAILAAEGAAPSIIVLMSDGDAQDTSFQDAALAALAGGAPVLSLKCAMSGSPAPAGNVMATVADASGGSLFDGGTLASPAASATAIEGAVRNRRVASYRLAYTAKTAGQATRNVKVTVAAASGVTSYALPTAPVAASAVAGLYLEITLGSETITRTLGGYDGGDKTPVALVNAAADAKLALLGAASVAFEGSAPTFGTWMGDVLDARLATEGAARALAAGDGRGGIAKFADVPVTLARQLAPLFNPIDAHAGATSFEESLRATLITARPDRSVRADVLALTRMTTASRGTPREIYLSNLRASASLAVGEAAAFRRTTSSLLAGKELSVLGPGSVGELDVPQVAPADRARFVRLLNQSTNAHRLVAKDGSTLAFWSVSPTGSCLGVLPDGSGGGENPCDELKTLNAMLDVLNLVGSVLGMPGIGIWISIAQMVVLAGVETVLAFSDSPPIVTGDQQLAAITCTFGAGVLGEMPLPIKGEGFTVNLIDTGKSYAVDTAVGGFKVCANPNPCK